MWPGVGIEAVTVGNKIAQALAAQRAPSVSPKGGQGAAPGSRGFSSGAAGRQGRKGGKGFG